MNSTALIILLVIGLIAFVVVFFFVMIRATSRYHHQISKVLLQLGFEKNDAGKELVTKGFAFVIERHANKRAVAINLHQKRAARYVIYVCEYHPMSSSGEAGGGERLLVGVVSQDMRLPRFTVEPIPQQAGWAGRILQTLSSSFPIPNLHKTQTPNLQFNKRFNLYTPIGMPISEVISDTSMLRLLSSGNVVLDGKDNILVLSSIDIEAERVAKKFDPDKLRNLIDLAETLADDFRR